MKKKSSLICSLSLLLISMTSCNSGTSNTTVPVAPVNNTVNLVVDSGINGTAWNRSYITLTICQPSTNNCQTIDHIIVDSGSTGLRINQAALSLSGLTALSSAGEPIYQCMQYAAGYAFGPVMSADVKIAGESAFNIPIQIFEYDNNPSVPESCTNGVQPANLITGFGANGIIGINPISNPNNDYTAGGVYTCNANTCTEVNDPNTTISQILNINPIAAFANDNNGAIFNLPAVNTASSESITGTLTFGLNTQTNNQVPTTINKLLGDSSTNYWPVGFFLANTGSQNTLAMFDSGTPYYAIYTPLLALCPTPFNYLYCPTSDSYALISMLSNFTGGSSTPFASVIANYSSLGGFAMIMPNLGGPQDPLNTQTLYGLPAFFGNNIYLGFKGSGDIGANTPLGQGPAWGFISN